MKRIEVAIAVVRRGNQILICQRKDNDTLGGFWEFPGGKRESGESLETCVARELMEEVDIRARIIQRLTTVEHTYSHGQIILHPFLCDHLDGDGSPIECQRLLWVAVGELGQYRFPPANGPLLKEIGQMMGSDPDGNG
jgi:mutator protein MutT